MMIDHIRYVPNQQETVYRNIKEKHLPVIVYGAGELALCVTNLLKKHSISPWAYAVDAPYYEQGRFYQGKPIWRFDFLARHPDQFVFVLGIGNPTVVKSFVKRDDICGFVLLSPYGEKAPITYSYLKEHETAFQQTYDWLEDDLSRRTMLAYLNLKISGNVRYNFDVMTSGQYFCECTSDFRGGHIHRLRRLLRRNRGIFHYMVEGELQEDLCDRSRSDECRNLQAISGAA